MNRCLFSVFGSLLELSTGLYLIVHALNELLFCPTPREYIICFVDYILSLIRRLPKMETCGKLAGFTSKKAHEDW